jgi:putative pyoverdin transport system ATP-binding/permease protein
MRHFQLVQLLLQESPDAWRRALIVAGVAGVGNAAILGIINRSASLASADSGMLNFRLLVLFGLCMLAFFAGKRYALIQSSIVVEQMIKNRLVRVSNKIRRAELELVESLGHGELFTRICQDTSLISQSGLILVNAAQQSLVLLFSLCYIAFLSPPAFLVTVGTIGVGVAIYSRHAESAQDLLFRLKEKESRLVDALDHMIDGFKEIRLNQKKSNAVFGEFTELSEAVRSLKIETQITFLVDIMFSDVFFYSLLAIVVFLLPRFNPITGSVALMTTAAILFIMGPLQLVVQAAPVFQRAKAAIASLTLLEDKLDRAWTSGTGTAAESRWRGFGTISIDSAVFAYTPREGANGTFSVGPLTTRIRRGETIFIVGGNGSGKTTVLKLLTGLYHPHCGSILVDRELMTRDNVQDYRELFSTVFSQFHLFDRLYGLEDVDPKRVSAILEEMQLSEKTRFEEGRFTDLNLSTGQRKRLALAVTLLEDKEILVFDEWAADQDPHFRRYFYEVVLKRLKAQGKTVIAVTHDERFWNLADRVIKMEYGSVVEDAVVTDAGAAV